MPLKLNVLTPAGVTATPNPLEITNCGTVMTVTFRASASAVSGTATVSVLSTPAGGGTYKNDVRIPITVNNPNTGPTVTIANKPLPLIEGNTVAGANVSWGPVAVADQQKFAQTHGAGDGAQLLAIDEGNRALAEIALRLIRELVGDTARDREEWLVKLDRLAGLDDTLDDLTAQLRKSPDLGPVIDIIVRLSLLVG